MQIIFKKPLIFIDNSEIDELYVSFFRLFHKMPEYTMAITHSEFSSLQDLIEEDASTSGLIDKAKEAS